MNVIKTRSMWRRKLAQVRKGDRERWVSPIFLGPKAKWEIIGERKSWGSCAARLATTGQGQIIVHVHVWLHELLHELWLFSETAKAAIEGGVVP